MIILTIYTWSFDHRRLSSHFMFNFFLSDQPLKDLEEIFNGVDLTKICTKCSKNASIINIISNKHLMKNYKAFLNASKNSIIWKHQMTIQTSTMVEIINSTVGQNCFLCFLNTNIFAHCWCWCLLSPKVRVFLF